VPDSIPAFGLPWLTWAESARNVSAILSNQENEQRAKSAAEFIK
jgi:hypothetical protein